ANSLVEGLRTSTAPDDLRAVVEGEARFLRAFAYLGLVKVYGNLPIILDGLTPTGDEQRATVLENYKHIEEDLLFAEANLPAPGATANFGRASAAAAKTALADLYLTWAGWPVKDTSKNALAATKAKEVIDMGYHTLIPINQLWLMENANSKESVFSVQYSKEEDQRNGMPAATSFHMARGWSDMYPELQFFKDFPEGPRKEATFVTDIPNRGFSGGKIITKTPATIPWAESQRFHPMYAKWTTSEDLTVAGRTMGYRAQEIYRYSEVLLIYAEAKAASGSMDASALEALNQVKRRAAGLDPNTADATVDVTTATVNEIVAEKGWELAGENKRWFDLIRTETLEDAIAKRDPNEQVPLVRQPTKAQYITPMPAEAIATSKLIQNPEGFKIQ
ncbi:MAG: RagB/SusD family nutrient uptake outer membrane protein, partial [Flavobacteriaceae bacterium]